MRIALITLWARAVLYGVLAVGAGVAAVRLPISLLIAAAAVLSVLFLSSRTIVAATFLLVCVLGLIRRILVPGRIDYDPLLLVPVALLVFAVAISGPVGHEKRLAYPVTASFIVLVTTPILSAMLSTLTLTSIYGAGIQSVAFLGMWAAALGRLPNLWVPIFRWAPFVGSLLATYGLFQFLVLPDWDRLWVIRSGLNSVGQPEPLLVRVFGSSESPGPFAMVLGGCLVIVCNRAIDARGLLMRVAHVGAGFLMISTLFFTGVRTALIAVVLALVYVVWRRRKVSALLVAVALGGGFVLSVRALLSRFASAESTVFDADRYSIAGSAQDRSLNARLSLWSNLDGALLRPLGAGPQSEGARTQSLDNAWIDLLVSFGPFMVIAFSVVVFAISRATLGNMESERTSQSVALNALTVFLLFFLVAGNPFATTSGLLASVVLGWTLSSHAISRATGETSNHKPTNQRLEPSDKRSL